LGDVKLARRADQRGTLASGAEAEGIREVREGRSPHALRFAKVAVAELCPPMPVIVRLHLANGRRAEII
jgi:hypothetical protein